MQLLILIICYLTMLIISITFSYKKALLSPQIGYCGGFLLQAIYALFWQEKYDICLSKETFFVLSFGAITFTLVSWIVQLLCGKLSIKYSSTNKNKNKRLGEPITIDNWKLVGFALFQIIVLVLVFRYILLGASGGFFNAINNFYQTHMLIGTSDNSIPTYIGLMRCICIASGYFWAYILCHNIIHGYEGSKKLLLVNVLLAVLLNIITGSRSGIIEMAIAVFVYVFMVYYFKSARSLYITPKLIGKILVLFVIGLFIFHNAAMLLGRTIEVNFSENLAVYLSAEIKNLDIFICSENFGRGYNIDTNNTLANIINSFSGSLGLPDVAHKVYSKFNFVNGYNLGNVATTYLPFVYDGGIGAVIIYTAIMSAIGQILFVSIIKKQELIRNIDIRIIAYGYMFFCYTFSFFSNRFYDMIITKYFINTIIVWFGLRFFVEKVNFNRR